jgi:hypothetical protein
MQAQKFCRHFYNLDDTHKTLSLTKLAETTAEVSRILCSSSSNILGCDQITFLTHSGKEITRSLQFANVILLVFIARSNDQENCSQASLQTKYITLSGCLTPKRNVTLLQFLHSCKAHVSFRWRECRHIFTFQLLCIIRGFAWWVTKKELNTSVRAVSNKRANVSTGQIYLPVTTDLYLTIRDVKTKFRVFWPNISKSEDSTILRKFGQKFASTYGVILQKIYSKLL